MFIDTGEAQICVTKAGAGTPLLLVHGLGMSSALWGNQIPAFEQRFTTYALDLRGFGRSSKPSYAGAYAIDELARDVASVIQQLDIAPCHILGTSMGGFVALSLAIAQPQLCNKLVLCHTAPRMSIPANVLTTRLHALARMSLAEYAPIVCEQALGVNASRSLHDWLSRMIEDNDKRAYTQVLSEGLSDFDVTDNLAHIAHSTLVITGEDDRVLPASGGREIAAAIEQAQLVEIAGVGHISYAERPEAFNAAVLDFL